MFVRFNRLARGVTLLETLLALAIVSVLLLITIRVGVTFTAEQNVVTLRANVDTLLLAMTNYYRANCSIFSPGGPSAALVSDAKPAVFISSANLAIYLPPANSINIFNPLVATGGIGTAYITQFNLMSATGQTVQMYVNCSFNDCNPSTTPPTSPAAVQGQNVRTIMPGPNGTTAVSPPPGGSLFWRIQVSVLQSTKAITKKNGYLNNLGADCLSSINSNTTPSTVYPCSSNQPGNYLVWERLPSFASPASSSTFWPMMPMLKSFNLQYTHDQMRELSPDGYTDAGSASYPNGPAVNNAAQQYYLCGG
jgi:prepilin-type N-terminal cleavage/methylation domain-containing protein